MTNTTGHPISVVFALCRCMYYRRVSVRRGKNELKYTTQRLFAQNISEINFRLRNAIEK